MDAFDAGRVAPEAVDGRGVDLAVQARQFVDERVVPVVRPIIRLAARRAVELDRVVSLEARPLRLVGAIAEGQQLAALQGVKCADRLLVVLEDADEGEPALRFGCEDTPQGQADVGRKFSVPIREDRGVERRRREGEACYCIAYSGPCLT